MKLFVLSPIADSFFSDQQKQELSKAGDLVLQKEIVPIEKVAGLTLPGDKLLALDPDWFDWKVPNEFLEKIPDIKGVILQTSSFSWLDATRLAQRGIPVVNMRGFSKNAVAEWAIMAALLLSRKMPIVIKDGWKQDFVKHKGFELRGKTAGVIGLGRNGSAIAELAAGLGMSVQYWSAHNQDERIKFVPLSELMKTSDVIFPAFAHNADTEKLLNDEALMSMKPSAIFVSTIHHIYNHDLLLRRVAEGKLWGYGFEENNPNFTAYAGNIWAGPALAWCTEESMRENARQWTEAILQAARGEFPNRIN
jgi:phosphoglycerate dehydrogenase-like enzyme